MCNRTLGNILTVIGIPAMVGVVGTMSCFSASGSQKNLLWSVPLALVSLPLLPFWLLGEKVLAKCNKEDFRKQTDHLPQVENNEGLIDIEECDGKFYLSDKTGCTPKDLDEKSFDSEDEARLFLNNMGYHEVVHVRSLQADHQWEMHPLQTYWMK